MSIWWDSLTLLERVFACIAIPATLILIVQLVLSLMGLGGHDADADFDSDADGFADGFDTNLEIDLDGDGIPDALELDLDGDGIPDDLETDFDADDLDADDAPEDAGSGHGDFNLKLFSFRGIIAFLAVYGWAALAVSRSGHPHLTAIIIGLILGFAAMLVEALVMRLFLRLQADGTVDIRNAVGLNAETYLTVPAARSGEGKVNVIIQDTMTECTAVTDESEPIPTGTPVTVIGVTGDRSLVVMRAPK